MTNKQLSLLHIEDDSLWQTYLFTALRVLPFVAHVERAPTGAAGLALARTLRPDIVLLDLGLPDADGVTLAAELVRLPRPPRVLLCTARRDAAVLHTASEPHIAGLLWKCGDVAEQLPAALATVAAGGKYYPPEVREALRRLRAAPQAFFKLLSPRQIALLPHFARAESDAEIATALGLSAHTVKSHRQTVMRKLDLHGAARLTHWAIVNGFGGATPPIFASAPNSKLQTPDLTIGVKPAR
ncbi:MAG: hypothetical protein C0502_11035 [Opitutus sp.]|nr:hypothetical protein [Opitutus sp.]